MPLSGIFINDFTVLDFAFASRELGVAGESFSVSAELSGHTDDKDFLLDFSRAKKLLKSLVDEAFDHKLLVPAGAELRPGGLRWRANDGSEWDYEAPREAFELFPDETVDAAVLEYHLARLAKLRLPANVTEARFRLRSPPRFVGEASFRYTHGLRYHDGNCQRLFHGHRNPVEVWINGERAPRWEAQLAQEWDGAHFVAAETLRNRAALDLPLGQRLPQHPGVAEVEYASSQGRFRGTLPAARVVLTEREPSIETMTALALERLRAGGLRGPVRVVGYEGLNKGASVAD